MAASLLFVADLAGHFRALCKRYESLETIAYVQPELRESASARPRNQAGEPHQGRGKHSSFVRLSLRVQLWGVCRFRNCERVQAHAVGGVSFPIIPPI
jgi:hypothetical protein